MDDQTFTTEKRYTKAELLAREEDARIELCDEIGQALGVNPNTWDTDGPVQVFVAGVRYGSAAALLRWLHERDWLVPTRRIADADAEAAIEDLLEDYCRLDGAV